MVPAAEPRSYYGRPVLKEPAWKPEVPVYFFAGGLAGASAGLAFAAERGGHPELARRAWINSFAAIAASPPLLIFDLGRPERFLNMLRVFKVTSPMSVGSWLLAGEGAAVTIAAASSALGVLPRAGAVAAPCAAALGMPLTTYTAVLLANTAVPAWHEGRRELPFVFAGSAAASAGAAAVASTRPRHAGPARRLAVTGAALELAAGQLMERRLGGLGEVYRQGAAGKLGGAAKALTAAGGAVVAARAGRSRRTAVVGAAMLLAGSVLERWSVFRAGFQSARDPSYTIGPQREQLDAGSAAVEAVA
jgi:polysulfide reductase-like protein